MLRIAVCDDENMIVDQIKNMIAKLYELEGISAEADAFYSGNDLEEEISKGTQYDLIFLDIQMQGGDGIATARNIRKMDENALLIYVSGHDEYALELFQFDVFAFIKKPIDENELIRVLLRANQKVCSKNFYFTFHYKNQEHKIPCRDILYFESRGRQIVIHIRNQKNAIFNEKLSNIEKQLAEGRAVFLRIHQSYLVNYHLIRARAKSEVILTNGEMLPISEERQKDFSRKYSKLLGDEIDV